MCKAADLFLWHFSERQIALISDQRSFTSNRRILGQLVDPLTSSFKTFSACYVKNKKSTVGALVVVRSKRLEALLTSRVPEDNLDLIWFVFEHDLPSTELHSDCGSERLRRHCVLHVSMDQCSLADP